MDRYTLSALYRSLTRDRIYTALNLGGLALGIAVFLVLGLYVRFETSFDRWLPRHDGVYLARTVWHMPGTPIDGAFSHTMGGLLDQLRQDFPGTTGTRIRGGEKAGTVIHDGVATTEDVAQVDTSFFQVFDLAMVRGNGASALKDPANAIISESSARRYFGAGDPVGQSMTITTDVAARYRIAGVFRDLPENTDVKLSILVPLPRRVPSENWFHWGNQALLTFLRFDTPAAARDFERKLPAFVDRRAQADRGKDASKTIGITLLPIERMHLQPEGRASASRKLTIETLGLVGLLTLLIAILNYINLATARAELRAREVAIRKVLGALRGMLIRQFLGESVVAAAVASLLGLILAELGMPLINAAGGLKLTIPYGIVVPTLVALAVLIGVVAGFYPALMLSHYSATAVLGSARAPGGGRAGTRIRESLVVLQFGFAVAFIIGTIVFVAQMRHVRQADLGFRQDGLLIVRSLSDASVTGPQKRAIATAVGALPGVLGVTLANGAAGGSGADSSENVALPGVARPGPSLRSVIVGPHFFEVYGARVLAGRTFDTDGAEGVHAHAHGAIPHIVLNRRALPALGFAAAADAIGKTVGGDRPRRIIGVIGDMRFASPREPTGATYYAFDPEPENEGTVVATMRVVGDPRAMLPTVRAVWQRIVPQVPFDGATAEQRLAAFYAVDDRVARLFSIGAALAVLIACIGVWGLASFDTTRRIKEIGIRKTLGASSGDIVRLLVGQFLRPVLIANLIAWPLALLTIPIWLAGFDDRIALSPLYFLAASAIAIAIAALTVLTQALPASRAPPSRALRSD